MKFTLPLLSSVAIGSALVSAFPANFAAQLDARSEDFAKLVRAWEANADPEALARRSEQAAQLDSAIKQATSTKYDAFAKHVAAVKKGGPIQPSSRQSTRKTSALIDPAGFKFNYKEQKVDLTSDEHKFVAPSDTDIRGPCPGLNLLANHGYLDHSGVTNLFQGVDAINKVFGVGYDLALALNGYAVLFNGNPVDLTWSIGGPYNSKGLGAVTQLLTGKPAGISAHNIYEGDASIVRQDYYAPGAKHDNYHLHLPFFQELLDLGGDSTPGKDVWTPDVMLKHKSNRWHYSVRTNPLFFNSAFGGLVVTTAAERFVAEFAANNTADASGYNRIYLDEPNLLAFFGVKKSKSGKLTYTPGHERLLPSWVRRPINADFGLDDIALTMIAAAAVDPSLISVGGNNGKVNSFTGVDAGDLSGGLYNTADLLKDPLALSCFIYQAGVEELVPTQFGLVYNLVGDITSLLGQVFQTIAAPHKNLATLGGTNPCDKFNSSVKKHIDSYPGSKFVLPK